jgi:Uma2 family endonuclease
MAERVKSHGSLTVDEYLALEESATVRHEYVGGEIFAMVGATKRHNRIIGNTSGRLWGTARGGPCRVYSESVKLRVADDVIYYPDVMVACGPEGDDPHIEDDPCLVVEVVSTRACYELGRKSHRNADSTVGLVPSRRLFPAFLSCF